MTRQEYIESRYEQHLSRWTNIAIGFGGSVSLALIPLDIVISPENGLRFSLYRIGMMLSFGVLLYFNRKKVGVRYNSIMGLIAGTLAAIMIAAMVYSFNGHESVYFAGFIILIIFMVGIIPYRLGMSIFSALLMYSFYLFPVLVYDDIANSSFFIGANVLMLACATSLLIMRYFSQQALISEFGLAYDVGQQREQLESYSQGLEALVEERTRDLESSENMLRSLFQGASVGIIISNESQTITGVNQLCSSMLGYERSELVGANIGKIEMADGTMALGDRFDTILSGETLSFEAQLRTREGDGVPVEMTSSAIEVGGETRVQFFVQDVTEKQKLIAQLAQSQKMEAVGRLAGGVAHDFNNLLMTIMGNCDLALLDLPAGHKVRKQIDEIKESAKRAAAVTSQLLSFSRKQVMKMERIDLNEIVSGMGSMLARLIGGEIELQVEVDPELLPIQGDRSRIEQVLMNLAVNARDAMPYGGLLTISAVAAELDAAGVEPFEGLVPGSYAMLTVTDSGEGIEKELLDNIFEPFFTTKELGKGTGLGLATVLGIVKQHEGYVYVDSDRGSGTTVTVLLPVAGEGEEGVSMIPEEMAFQWDMDLEAAGPELRGSETILVVDDEAAVRQVVARALKHLGYELVEASSGERALEVCRDRGGDIDLVLTDVIMPGMNGRELVDAVHLEYPGMMSLFMSGYTDDIISRHGLPNEDSDFIQKPISAIALARKLRLLLN